MHDSSQIDQIPYHHHHHPPWASPLSFLKKRINKIFSYFIRINLKLKKTLKA